MRRLVLLVVLAFAAPAAAQSQPELKQPEVLTHKPSGFWTSPRPAQGGAYRYRMMGIGAALLLATGLLTWRLVKRANAERAHRNQPR
jgi:hypothetical protein